MDKTPLEEKPDKAAAEVPPPEPPVEAPVPLKALPGPSPSAKAAADAQRRLTDALKAGMIDGLKKVSSQIAHSTDLNFAGMRATSIQRHPDGGDLVVVVDVVPNVFRDGPLSK